MKILIQDELAWVSATVTFQGRTITFENVLLDTGSSGCIFPAHRMEEIDFTPEPLSPVFNIQGVGGKEPVFMRLIDVVMVGEFRIENFMIEVGAMKYDFPIDGIIGLDFLLAVKASIDLDKLELRSV
jgi:hypothetical protein